MCCNLRIAQFPAFAWISYMSQGQEKGGKKEKNLPHKHRWWLWRIISLSCLSCLIAFPFTTHRTGYLPENLYHKRSYQLHSLLSMVSSSLVFFQPPTRKTASFSNGFAPYSQKFSFVFFLPFFDRRATYITMRRLLPAKKRSY